MTSQPKVVFWTDIVSESRFKLGFAAADELRELAAMKKIGITAAQSALGFHAATAMLRIERRSFQSLQWLQGYWIVTREYLFTFLVDLLELSKTIMPLPWIPR